MKQSEYHRKLAENATNDFRSLSHAIEELRCGRIENFEENWLPRLRAITEVTLRVNLSYTFDSSYGIIDYFPKANKLLIRKESKWVKPALKFIVENIIKKAEEDK